MIFDQPLRTPSAERIAAAPLTAFAAEAEKRTGREFAGYAELHTWSIAERDIVHGRPV